MKWLVPISRWSDYSGNLSMSRFKNHTASDHLFASVLLPSCTQWLMGCESCSPYVCRVMARRLSSALFESRLWHRATSRVPHVVSPLVASLGTHMVMATATRQRVSMWYGCASKAEKPAVPHNMLGRLSSLCVVVVDSGVDKSPLVLVTAPQYFYDQPIQPWTNVSWVGGR